jgi:hypothetical protein
MVGIVGLALDHCFVAFGCGHGVAGNAGQALPLASVLYAVHFGQKARVVD